MPFPGSPSWPKRLLTLRRRRPKLVRLDRSIAPPPAATAPTRQADHDQFARPPPSPKSARSAPPGGAPALPPAPHHRPGGHLRPGALGDRRPHRRRRRGRRGDARGRAGRGPGRPPCAAGRLGRRDPAPRRGPGGAGRHQRRVLPHRLRRPARRVRAARTAPGRARALHRQGADEGAPGRRRGACAALPRPRRGRAGTGGRPRPRHRGRRPARRRQAPPGGQLPGCRRPAHAARTARLARGAPG